MQPSSSAGKTHITGTITVEAHRKLTGFVLVSISPTSTAACTATSGAATAMAESTNVAELTTELAFMMMAIAIASAEVARAARTDRSCFGGIRTSKAKLILGGKRSTILAQAFPGRGAQVAVTSRTGAP